MHAEATNFNISSLQIWASKKQLAGSDVLVLYSVTMGVDHSIKQWHDYSVNFIFGVGL